MRISDWSSDVCSSDLEPAGGVEVAECVGEVGDERGHRGGFERRGLAQRCTGHPARDRVEQVAVVVRWLDGASDQPRSEEHTSELQSLMRISYAVFCLKKKTKTSREE